MIKRSVLLLVFIALTTFVQAQPVSQTSRPWTYWWWMGSAVNEVDITRQLEQFASVGLGEYTSFRFTAYGAMSHNLFRFSASVG
ncbi:hypothetical protein [Spirosoma sp. KNUC1025]|uniref:hypothetical protein n=1 Tax=Spirosoma sp. KNUC1025 TaxID=2894082 RepID=UPI0038638F2E